MGWVGYRHALHEQNDPVGPLAPAPEVRMSVTLVQYMVSFVGVDHYKEAKK
jgi:hypothetical protein